MERSQAKWLRILLYKSRANWYFTLLTHVDLCLFVCLWVYFVLTSQITEEWIFSFPPFLSSGSCANISAWDCESTTLQTCVLCQEKSTGKQKAKAWGRSDCQDLLSPGEPERGKRREKKRTVMAFTADSDSVPGQKETQNGRRVAKLSGQLAVTESRLSWRLLALSASPTAGVVPALRDWVLRLQVNWKPNLHSAVNQCFNLGN